MHVQGPFELYGPHQEVLVLIVGARLKYGKPEILNVIKCCSGGKLYFSSGLKYGKPEHLRTLLIFGFENIGICYSK